MKSLNRLFKSLLFIAITSMIVVGCNKDDDSSEPNKTYVGTWQSDAFQTLDLATQNPVWQKMTFTFTNTTVEDEIMQGTEETSITEFKGAIRGEITNPTEKDMDIEITELSIIKGVFVKKSSDPAGFTTAWGATFGQMLDEKFELIYNIDNNKMELILPVKVQGETVTDTLNLTKM